jgi:hypothetical protein
MQATTQYFLNGFYKKVLDVHRPSIIFVRHSSKSLPPTLPVCLPHKVRLPDTDTDPCMSENTYSRDISMEKDGVVNSIMSFSPGTDKSPLHPTGQSPYF